MNYLKFLAATTMKNKILETLKIKEEDCFYINMHKISKHGQMSL